MNTPKSLVILAAMSWGLVLGPVARASNVPVRVILAASAVGQSAKAKAAGDRKEVEGLLLRARQAMKDGDWEGAESVLVRAEKLKVEYSVFHLGDTPKKARTDLEAAKRKTKKDKLSRPSEKFNAKLPDSTMPPAVETPSADRSPRVPLEVSGPESDAPVALPASEGRLKQAPISQHATRPPDTELTATSRLPAPDSQPVAPEGAKQARAQSDGLLLAARRALAVGDLRRASAALEAARKFNVAYDHHDDTPDRVDTAIRNYRQVTETLGGRQDEAARRQIADQLMEQAQALLRWKDYDEAERLAKHVQGLRVGYGPFESRPEALLEKIAVARKTPPAATAGENRIGLTVGPANAPDSAVRVVGGAMPQGGPPYPATRALYDRQKDTSRNRVAAGQQDVVAGGEDGEASSPEVPGTLPTPAEEEGAASEIVPLGIKLFRQGQQALKDRDSAKALEYFKQAHEMRDQLDAATAQRLQDFLQMLSNPPAGGKASGDKPQMLSEGSTTDRQLLTKQVVSDLAQKEVAAGKARKKDPKRATEILKEARAAVESAGLDPSDRNQLLRRVDRKIAELDKYIADNRADLELDAANKEVLKEVDRRRENKLEIDDKLAKMVDDYNTLMDQERYAEAEVIAKRARELDPDNPLVKQLFWNQRFTSRNLRNQKLIEDKEKGVWEALDSVEQAAIPESDREPYRMPDLKKWEDLTNKRKRQMAERRARRSERELEIERNLKTPVSLKYRNRPLNEVIDQLGKLAGVNVHLDDKGLDEEGVPRDTPVTIDLTNDITLKSALQLILEPLHLSYVIKNEVLLITSEQLRDGEIYPLTYDVADLVIPIPNFLPNGRDGLSGAIAQGYSISAGAGMGGGPGPAFSAAHDSVPAGSANMNAAVLAQMNQLMPGGMGSRPAGAGGGSVPFGPGGVGQGAQPDFEPLIELITSTIKPQTWDEVGGPGTISSYTNNLSLVISNTEDVHQAVADLLEQLRRNQDLQVTIEVRFITLNDNFFERIGVDFQFNVVNTSATQNPSNPGVLREIVGLETVAGNAPSGNAPNFAPNLELPFRQNSFNLATPQFGQPVDVASFGFAILSDIEAYLLVNAAQGDRRTNVLQAPKVTMFNGQLATVSDQSFTPFVITVIPVVGDFAAAYQPVITVLSEGTSLSVQATISHDRRFVRLTVLPYFSTIGDVTEFTFSGTKTTNSTSGSSSSTGGSNGDSNANAQNSATTSEGITVQLPTFAIVTVSTTVSVPDGGTVLLGGIKRLSEGRNEFGVPILSKLPYINRLFKNIGIGRETQSLMMMVTPRIIIQEEEEERLGVQLPP